MKAISLTLILLSTIVLISSHTKEEWKSRAIYQLLTDRFARDDDSISNCDLGEYCGGTFQGIIDHLDYIKGMGFDAIWISPVLENTEHSYHGYAATNWYKINPHFGTADKLKELVNICHSKDIWVMIDVVLNHVGNVGTDYSRIYPFNKAEHYHDRCDIDYNNQTSVENCRLCDLPDLKQENEWVKNELIKWAKWLISEFNFDGMRIDTVKHVPKWFWDEFDSQIGTFQLGEVFEGNIDYCADYQNHMDSMFNYPLYYTIQDSFCGSMKKLENYLLYSHPKFLDTSVLGTIVENHDNPRFLNRCSDRKKFKNAIIFSIMFEGIPVIYYGGEQWYSGGADPNNREPLWGNYNTYSEMYVAISKALKVRKDKQLWTKNITQRYADDVFYAFTRGDVLICLTRGESCTRTITYHDYNSGDKLCNAFDPSDCVTVDGKNIYISMGQDPKIYIKQ